MDLSSFMAAQFPVQPLYLGSTLEPLPEPAADSLFAHRFILAADGVWRQIRTPWLSALYPICTSEKRLPFAPLVQEIRIILSLPQIFDIVAGFARIAGHYQDHEVHQDLFIDHRGSITPGPLDHGDKSHIEYRRNSPPGALFLDLHSHGILHSYFSSTDDRDDQNDLKVAVVVGDLQQSNPTFHIRTCLQYGIFLGGTQCYTVAA